MKNLIDEFALDLKGLNVITECASEAYSLSPLGICLAGGRAICVGKDSSFASFSQNKKNLNKLMKLNNIPKERYKIFKDEIPINYWKEVDIVCNSGFVRKIAKDKIESLKSTAVISLMWETWEFRNEDIDLKSCQINNIPVIGTNESYKLINMFDYNIFIVMKLLFNLDLEINNSVIVLIGGHKTGESIAKRLSDLGINYYWFTTDGNERQANCYPFKSLRKILDFRRIDAIISVEHSNKIELIGNKSQLNFAELKFKFPQIVFGHICGNIDIDDLNKSTIRYAPSKIEPFGYMSYQAYNLGPRPVIELNIAGLLVGQIAVRARLKGLSVKDSILKAVNHGIGQDFEGGFENANRTNIC